MICNYNSVTLHLILNLSVQFHQCLLAPWSSLLDKPHDLVKPRGKQVQCSDNTTIGTKLVLFHHFLVVNSVSNV